MNGPDGPDGPALLAWLAEQRWFGAKGGTVELADVVSVPLAEDPPLALDVITLDRPDRAGPDRYQLLRGGAGEDALADPRAAAALVDLFRRRATCRAGPASVTFCWDEDRPPPPPGPVRPLGLEQSNSSVVVDEAFVVKVFRRLEPGENPELELLRFLGRHGFTAVAPVAGWYRLDDGDGTTTLGVVQELVVPSRDGWGYVLDALAGGDRDAGTLLAPLRSLGTVLGELHRVLASDPDDPDFAPEPAPPGAPAEVAAVLAAGAEELFAQIDPGGPAGPLAGRAEDVAVLAERLAAAVAGGRHIRHHGDLHLGQTLLTPRGWVILDFEGEPARSLADRRARRSPLRDVAGMLRSFAYAVAASERATGRPAAGEWEAAARAAFLDGYLATVDPTLLPATAPAVVALLALLELEKVVYELGYEMGNRPDWAAIPAAGLLRLLDGAGR